ncbi:hypothetical protein EVAR_49692_1 [Eumeta japonica]|uniref:Uncharacterized protein n=1 Tax=Eumeta variegata TaxID=151549 RepID=A0A4C1WTZ0_EUMVA|nr:hypothetical protein EVAR_49692_1 [Eumeta japonica]
MRFRKPVATSSAAIWSDRKKRTGYYGFESRFAQANRPMRCELKPNETARFEPPIPEVVIVPVTTANQQSLTRAGPACFKAQDEAAQQCVDKSDTIAIKDNKLLLSAILS